MATQPTNKGKLSAPTITHSHTEDYGDPVNSIAAIDGQFYCVTSDGITNDLFNCTIYQPTSGKVVSVASAANQDFAVMEMNSQNNTVTIKYLHRAAWVQVWEQAIVLTAFVRGCKSAAQLDVCANVYATVDPHRKLLVTFDYKMGAKTNYSLNQMKKPFGVCMISADEVLVGDQHGHTVTKFRLVPSGSLKVLWTCRGLTQPSGICADHYGLIYVGSYTKNTVYVLSPTGKS